MRRHGTPKQAGFTLAEIMVAMSIFLMIGGMLLMALRSGVDTWARTEERRQTYEDAQTLLSLMREDLSCLVSTGGSSGDPRVLLLCDFDGNRRPRLRFIRTLKAEDRSETLRYAGAGTPEEGYTEYMTEKGDYKKRLKPLDGLQEVAYVFDPEDSESTVLYRGVRSPIGEEGSLFVDENISTSKQVKAAMTPVSNYVLHLGFAFKSQYSTTWDTASRPGKSLGSRSGPSITWDSTRGILPVKSKKKKDPNVFFLAANDASRVVPADDVFPRQVQLTLVLCSRSSHEMRTELAEDVASKEKRLSVLSGEGFADETDSDPARCLLVGREWIQYKERAANEFILTRRGTRGTLAQSHKAGAVVRSGRAFVSVIGIPTYREYWFGSVPLSGK